MFKSRKIQRRANELYTQMWKENTIITITGESYYDSVYRINLNVGRVNYQTRIADGSIPVKPGTTERTNSMKLASFVAYAIASNEYGRKPEKYLRAFNKCELI